MASGAAPRDRCPTCGAPITLTKMRDGLAFYICPKCQTQGADADPEARLKSGERLLRFDNDLLQRAKQRIRTSRVRMGKG